MPQLLVPPRQKFFDSNGKPLAGGKLYSYAAGTSAPLATYTDQTGSSANTNPVILDSNGEAAIWIGPLAYKIVLQDALGNTLWTSDGIQSIYDGSIGLSKLTSFFLTRDADGLAKMADGYLANTPEARAKMADGFLSADAGGRAKMANGYFAANTDSRAKFVDNFFSADDAGRAKMQDGFVTQRKREPLNQKVSGSSGSFSTGNGASTFVPNLVVGSVGGNGRPIKLGLQYDGVLATPGSIKVEYATIVNAVSAQADVFIYRDAQVISWQRFGPLALTQTAGINFRANQNFHIPLSAIEHIDFDVAPIPYTQNYAVAVCVFNATSISVLGAKLYAYEL